MATACGILGLFVGIGIGAASGDAVTTATAEPAQAAGGAPTARPKSATTSPGIDVSGDHAADLRVISFKARRDALGDFAPVLRIHNTSGDDLSYISVKVTVLKGEDVVATADGIIETIDAGQTITHEPLSGDKFRTGTRYHYAIELD